MGTIASPVFRHTRVNARARAVAPFARRARGLVLGQRLTTDDNPVTANLYCTCFHLGGFCVVLSRVGFQVDPGNSLEGPIRLFRSSSFLGHLWPRRHVEETQPRDSTVEFIA